MCKPSWHTLLAVLVATVAAVLAAEGPCAPGGPGSQGWRMAAEWEPQQQTWLGWPWRPDVWRDNATHAQEALVQVAQAIAAFENVTVGAPPDQLAAVRAQLPPGVAVAAIPQDDAWFRDTGPTFLVRDSAGGARSVAGVDWSFNSWGELSVPYDQDDAVATEILQAAGLQSFSCDLVIEGGVLQTDGEGTLLTITECVLDPRRNPGLTQQQAEACFASMLGVQKVIWLPQALYGDGIVRHTDNLATFARPGVVLLAWPGGDAEGAVNSDDPQLAISQAALEALEAATDAQRRRLQVIKLPLPPPQFMTDAEIAGLQEDGSPYFFNLSMVLEEGTFPMLAASYNNYLLLNNGGLLAPAFTAPGHDVAWADERARRVLQQAFPQRRIVQVPVRELVLNGGSLHCISAQQPAGWQAPP